MERERPNNQNLQVKEGCIIIPNSFFKEWVKVLGGGPTLLYLELLTYCHQEKDLAWPTLKTLSRHLQMTTKTLTRHHRRLAQAGLIKKVFKSKTASGNYKRNIYQLTLLDRVKNTLSSGKNFSYIGEKITPKIGKKLPINNNNKQNQYNNKGVVVDFKKLKEEERRKRIKEDLTGLDFKDSFREKLLKDFPLEKIEEKLELLKEKKHIINPSGWLMAALKNDYQGCPEEEIQEVREEKKEEPPRKYSSREEALEQIRKTREMLANL